MSFLNYRFGIFLLTIITAVIHLYLNLPMGEIDPLFTANSIGYMVLLYALLSPVDFLEKNTPIISYGFMLYTFATIVAWLFLGDKTASPLGILGYVDKVVEILLIVMLWLNLREHRELTK